MLAKIVGVEPVNYNRRSDGAPVSGITLYLEYKVSSVWGIKTCDVYVGTDKPMYDQFVPFKDKPTELIDKEISLERNDKGFIEDLTLKL